MARRKRTAEQIVNDLIAAVETTWYLPEFRSDFPRVHAVYQDALRFVGDDSAVADEHLPERRRRARRGS